MKEYDRQIFSDVIKGEEVLIERLSLRACRAFLFKLETDNKNYF